MTKKEIGQLVALAIANYPHIQDKDMRMTARLWEDMLSDLPFNLTKTALYKVLSTAKFWPSVAEIREAALSLTQPPAPTALEAWGMVREAIRWDKPASTLHPAIQKAILAFGGLDGIGYSESIDYIQGQFMKQYDPLAKKEQELAALPAQVREFLSGVEVKQIAGH